MSGMQRICKHGEMLIAEEGDSDTWNYKTKTTFLATKWPTYVAGGIFVYLNQMSTISCPM